MPRLEVAEENKQFLAVLPRLITYISANKVSRCAGDLILFLSRRKMAVSEKNYVEGTNEKGNSRLSDKKLIDTLGLDPLAKELFTRRNSIDMKYCVPVFMSLLISNPIPQKFVKKLQH